MATSVLRIFFMMIMIRMLLRLFLAFSASRKQKNMKTSGKTENRSNEWEKRIEEIKNEKEINMMEMVKDKVCDTHVQKSKSYIVVKDNEKHYFCSWDCRQKFLEQDTEKSA